MQDFRFLPQLFASTGERNGAALHNIGSIGEAQRERRELLDEQNTDPSIGDRLYRLSQPAYDRGREPKG